MKYAMTPSSHANQTHSLTKLIGGLAVACCLAWPHLSHAILAGGMVSNEFQFDQKSGGYNRAEMDIQVTTEPGNDGRTFWASQLFFGQRGGYIGMQQNDGANKTVLFSIWDALSGTAGPGAQCVTFGGEGAGISCRMAFPWKEGARYRFVVKKVSATATAETWRGDVVSLDTGSATTIGEITQPRQQTGINPVVSQFVENFTQGAQQYQTCQQTPKTEVIFYPPKLDGANPSTANSQTYGNCAQIAKTQCTEGKACIASINMGPVDESVHLLQNPTKGLCADTLGGGDSLGLYHCQAGNANQRIARTTNGQLQLIARGLCLQSDAPGTTVKAKACTNSDRQKWLPLGGGSAWVNIGTMSCLDAAGGGTLLAGVQTYLCKSSTYQRWMPINP